MIMYYTLLRVERANDNIKMVEKTRGEGIYGGKRKEGRSRAERE